MMFDPAAEAVEPRAEAGNSLPRVAVLGAGAMAPGIAAAFAAAGHEVLLWSRRPDRTKDAVARAVEMVAFLAAARLGAAPPATAAITAVDGVEALADADVAIEAVAEELTLKRELLARLDGVLRSRALVLTNTSGLRVTDIARESRRPERVVAMHFWNPAHLMPLVEIGGGEATAPDMVARAIGLARSIGKQPVRLRREVLGFLGTRLQQAVVREAIWLLESGVASAGDIDLAVRTSFGIRFPVMGPLESADLTGLDVIEAIHRYLLPDLDDSTEPQALLSARVAAGELGAKTGKGFYDWTVRDARRLARERDEELVRRLRLLASPASGCDPAAGRGAVRA